MQELRKRSSRIMSSELAASTASLNERPSNVTPAEEEEEDREPEMDQASRKSQWIGLAVASGACAAFNGVFAKLYVPGDFFCLFFVPCVFLAMLFVSGHEDSYGLLYLVYTLQTSELESVWRVRFSRLASCLTVRGQCTWSQDGLLEALADCANKFGDPFATQHSHYCLLSYTVHERLNEMKWTDRWAQNDD